jgi:hypothetical protein
MLDYMHKRTGKKKTPESSFKTIERFPKGSYLWKTVVAQAARVLELAEKIASVLH